jgi:hypothetical protein
MPTTLSKSGGCRADAVGEVGGDYAAVGDAVGVGGSQPSYRWVANRSRNRSGSTIQNGCGSVMNRGLTCCRGASPGCVPVSFIGVPARLQPTGTRRWLSTEDKMASVGPYSRRTLTVVAERVVNETVPSWNCPRTAPADPSPHNSASTIVRPFSVRSRYRCRPGCRQGRRGR